ncbi:serine hydrolase [Actinocatenispora thailandica]|uniref:Serine hydrolase n=1 Tax=Actinocatenispora thailandica TaxID=227318 RepID=A0A7R7DQS7_9ACTN|nr:serine hydrolase domain-containing protein [Actinocatenispora thailandica]BCJ35807.1 serine hydrolase [Actinocatenispora thailandica]
MAVDPNSHPGLLPDTVARLDAAVAAAQATGRVPSLIAGVVRAGTLVHVAGAGEVPTPTADLQYRIGSISKTLTAALVLRLRDAGALALDDPLAAHLPGTPVGAVTVRQLLGHVSGLQREPDGDWWERSAGGDVEALLAGLDAGKLAGPPFAGYHYSNLAYGLLGALLTRAAGQPWWQLVRDQLLAPLGMTRTSYQPTEPFARGYVVHPWLGTLREEPRHDAGAMAPAGQLWSTVGDLTRWAAFLADPATAGGETVLAATTVDEMAVPVAISDLESWTAGHGLGVELWRRGERVYLGHTGSMPGYLAVLVVHRRSRTGVVAFANAYTMLGSGIGGFGIDLLTTVLDNEPEPVSPWRPGEPAPAEVAPLTGRWWWMGREYEAGWTDGALVLRAVTMPGGTPWRFTPEAPDVWRCHTGMNTGEILTVRRGPDGAVSALDIATFVFRRDVLPAE